MTKKEALVAVVQVTAPDNSVEKALTDESLTGSENYTKEDEEAVDKCAIRVLQGLLSAPNITEGGYSISYDRKAIQARIASLQSKYDLADESIPAVKAVSVW